MNREHTAVKASGASWQPRPLWDVLFVFGNVVGRERRRPPLHDDSIARLTFFLFRSVSAIAVSCKSLRLRSSEGLVS